MATATACAASRGIRRGLCRGPGCAVAAPDGVPAGVPRTAGSPGTGWCTAVLYLSRRLVHRGVPWLWCTAGQARARVPAPYWWSRLVDARHEAAGHGWSEAGNEPGLPLLATSADTAIGAGEVAAIDTAIAIGAGEVRHWLGCRHLTGGPGDHLLVVAELAVVVHLTGGPGAAVACSGG